MSAHRKVFNERVAYRRARAPDLGSHVYEAAGHVLLCKPHELAQPARPAVGLARACPYCDAMIGCQCVSDTGRPVVNSWGNVHSERNLPA